MCGYLVKNTKNENSHRGITSIFFPHLKSPESLVYFYPSLVRCHHGSTRSVEKFVVHLWDHSHDCFVLSCWDLCTGVQDWRDTLHFINIAWKLFTYPFTTFFNPLVHIFAVAPKQNQLIGGKMFCLTYLGQFDDNILFDLLEELHCSYLFVVLFIPDPHCENWKDPCDPNPCRNDGICSKGPTGFLCRCPEGFAGLRCHINCTQPACLEDRNCTAGRDVRARNQCNVLWSYQMSGSWKAVT